MIRNSINKFYGIRILFYFCFLFLGTIILTVTGLVSNPAYADLKTQGKGKKIDFVREQFVEPHLSQYDVFRAKCTKCHGLIRPIAAITTGITPVTGDDFDRKYTRKYVVKMMRKPNSGITKVEAKEVLKFILHAFDLLEGK